MTFSFRQVTVSGGNTSIEGTSAVINEITDVLVNECGWVIEDDRRAQAGSTLVANTHKIVLNSNGGESGTDPNWYFTLVSGVNNQTAKDKVSIQISTAYDSGTHLPPASGVALQDTTTVSTLTDFDTDSDGYNQLFISADKDGVAIFNNVQSTTWGICLVGKAISFLDETFEPYGLYSHTSDATSVVGNSWLGIVGNPPQAMDNNSSGNTVFYSGLSTTNEPRQGLGNEEAIFTGLPLLFVLSDTSTPLVGAVGFVRHVFGMTGNLSGVPFMGKMTVPATGQEFIVFGGSTSIAVRAS